MTVVENKRFGEERALYGSDDISVISCRFEGEEDGESALKESRNIRVEASLFDLRYPFWHDSGVNIDTCTLTEKCRAAIWYSEKVNIKNSHLHGTKAIRECSDIEIADSDVISEEFGWFSGKIKIKNTSVTGEYFMLHSSALDFENVTLDGKYSFQYVENSEIRGCTLRTKDAFWHAKNVVVKDSYISGAYLAWYAENITFINCKISGTQPFCYCKNLKLVNCSLEGADFAFEKSSVDAEITSHIISIRNPASGRISAPSADELIDVDGSDCEIIIGK